MTEQATALPGIKVLFFALSEGWSYWRGNLTSEVTVNRGSTAVIALSLSDVLALGSTAVLTDIIRGKIRRNEGGVPHAISSYPILHDPQTLKGKSIIRGAS